MEWMAHEKTHRTSSAGFWDFSMDCGGLLLFRKGGVYCVVHRLFTAFAKAYEDILDVAVAAYDDRRRDALHLVSGHGLSFFIHGHGEGQLIVIEILLDFVFHFAGIDRPDDQALVSQLFIS